MVCPWFVSSSSATSASSRTREARSCGAVVLVLLVVSGCQPPSRAPKSNDNTTTGSGGVASGAVEPEVVDDMDDIEIDTGSLVAKEDVSEVVSEVADAVAEDLANQEVVLGDKALTSGIPGEGPLTVDQVKDWLATESNHEPLAITLPFGIDGAKAQITGIDVNPITRAKIELGRQLYFDRRLSADATVSCADCHHPDEGYGRHTQFGVGIDGQTGNRNSPVSYNRIVSGPQFWDGRAASLEEQAVGPIANPIEMGNSHEKAVETIASIEGYRLQFDRIFADGVTIENVGKAIATFERTIVTGPAPYDYYEIVRTVEEQFDEEEIAELADEDPEFHARYLEARAKSADMSDSARRGRTLFFGERGGCTACHSGANFTDEQYHNLGVGMDADDPDLGRFAVTKVDKDRGGIQDADRPQYRP